MEKLEGARKTKEKEIIFCYNAFMKIIEGAFAGKQIQYQEQKGTRVTSEKVRKAVFDVLKNMVDFEDLKVADLFCGSGMYGIESLSRGAKDVLFLDNSAVVLGKLKGNLAQLKVESYEIIKSGFDNFIKNCDKSFDLVFVDPPYYKFDTSKFNTIYSILEDSGIFVLETSERIKIGELQGLELLTKKKYGGTVVLFFIKK